MSYTVSSATATCSLTELESTRTLALAIYDYLVNHPDEIPSDLAELDSDEVVLEIESYLAIENANVTIKYSTEECNSSSEVFDFLSHHCACLQTSPFMEVRWLVEDSRDGADFGVDYYDRAGARVDVKGLLLTYLAAA
jgi:hypothetical protein